jgi:deoxyadenosine/deoxycytidine kinase
MGRRQRRLTRRRTTQHATRFLSSLSHARISPMTKQFVAVAGNIGAGKSTLVALLSQRLGWQPFYEAVAENPYLADFYADMHQWGFHSQVFFLSNRLRAHRQLVDHPTSVVQDRSVYEDAEVFACNLYHQGYLNERDYRAYRDLYESINAFLPPPDLIVYLRAPIEALRRRIAQRGRDYEQTIDPAYLAQLNQLYEDWIRGFTLCPVLTVPAGDLDYVANPADLDLIAHDVLAKLSS